MAFVREITKNGHQEAIFGAALRLAGWTDAPPPLKPYTHMPSTHQPLPMPQPVRPTVPSGPTLGSPIERCLQIQQRGGLSAEGQMDLRPSHLYAVDTKDARR